MRAGRHLGADRSGAASRKARRGAHARSVSLRCGRVAERFGRRLTLAISGRQLRLLYWSAISTGRLASEVADEAPVSLAHGELTAEVAMSLTTRPDDFVVTVYGTRATLRLDRSILRAWVRGQDRSPAARAWSDRGFAC
jgi:hypothetical protein